MELHVNSAIVPSFSHPLNQVLTKTLLRYIEDFLCKTYIFDVLEIKNLLPPQQAPRLQLVELAFVAYRRTFLYELLIQNGSVGSHL